MKIRILHSVLCLCLLLLGGCAATMPNAASIVENDGPFARTGLLAYPGERPEEIVLRAHAGDVRAVALVAAGYYYGIEGFPKDEFLPTSWLHYLHFQIGAVSANDFLLTMIHSDISITERDAIRTAECERGMESYFAPIFKQAGIFDIEKRCLELMATPAKNESEWAVRHKEKVNYWKKRWEENAAEVAMMRELRTRPATKYERELLTYSRQGSEKLSWYLKRFLFYAATTHDLESESPDWSDARLMTLMARDRKDQLWLGSEIMKEITLRATLDPSLPLDIIRRAHSGENDAMVAMARNYTGGEMGFPLSPGLSLYWLKRSSEIGKDAMSIALGSSRIYLSNPFLTNFVLDLIGQVEKSDDSRAKAIAATLKEILLRQKDVEAAK